MRASLTAFGVLVVFAVAGTAILNLFGITLHAFRIAGGLLLFSIASEMVFGVRTVRQSQQAGPPDEKFVFGRPGMIPLSGDWNGGGKDGVGYYNPATGIFSLRVILSQGPVWDSFRFGPPHMIPIAGNWSGYGRKDGVGYYNPRTGTFYLRDRLGAIAIPTIVLHGTRDRLFPLLAARVLAAGLPRAELRIVEGAGHVLPLTHGEAVLGAVRDLLPRP